MSLIRNIVVFDFETSSVDTETTQILQIGAVAIDGKSFRILDDFTILVRPEDPDAVEEGALKANGLRMEDLMEAPDIKTAFTAFADWCKQHYSIPGNSFSAPVPCGYNINNFDIPILKRYCKRFGYVNKKGLLTILSGLETLDVFSHIWLYTRHLPTDVLPNRKLTTVLSYMGVSDEEIQRGAHDALWDVYATADLGIRMLKLGKQMTAHRPGKKPFLAFENSLEGATYKVGRLS